MLLLLLLMMMMTVMVMVVLVGTEEIGCSGQYMQAIVLTLNTLAPANQKLLIPHTACQLS